MPYLKFTWILLILALTSCSQNRKHADWISEISSDTLRQNIKTEANGDFPIAYKYKKKLSEFMNFADIEHGFDLVDIRIWYGYYNTDSVQIIDLKNTKKKWTGEQIIASPKFDGKDSLVNVIFSRRELKPKDGWNNFINRLNDIGLFSMSCSNKILNASNVAESDGISIEIATANYYSFCNYPTPGSIAEKDSLVSQTLEHCLRLINDQFDIQSWRATKKSRESTFEEIDAIEIKMKE